MSSEPIKRIISSLTGFLPVEKIISANERRLILPFWHAVSDAPLPHLSQLYRVPTISEFERDLDFLLLNYKPASIDDIFRHATSREKPEKNLFFPSFDDGLAECYHVIAPILKKKGIPAAFFINPLFVDNKMLFHRLKASLILNSISKQKSKYSGLKEAEQLLQQLFSNKNLHQFLHQATYTDHSLLDEIAEILNLDFDYFLKQNQPYMTLQQIKELQGDGFLIGAHGMDHREFFLSSEDEIMNQISESMEFLIQEINPPIKTFAFPFTDFKVPDIVFEKANQAKLWDMSFGTAGIKDETMQNHLQRIPMELNESTDGKQTIRTEYIWYYLKSVFGKNKVRRQ
jgi:peptidoglycan/xylan/chitin deacetylase (PgdA/CDA1 family)